LTSGEHTVLGRLIIIIIVVVVICLRCLCDNKDMKFSDANFTFL